MTAGQTENGDSGFDTNARLLQTVVLVFAIGDEVVTYAMPARKRYLDLLP